MPLPQSLSFFPQSLHSSQTSHGLLLVPLTYPHPSIAQNAPNPQPRNAHRPTCSRLSPIRSLPPHPHPPHPNLPLPNLRPGIRDRENDLAAKEAWKHDVTWLNVTENETGTLVADAKWVFRPKNGNWEVEGERWDETLGVETVRKMRREEEVVEGNVGKGANDLWFVAWVMGQV